MDYEFKLLELFGYKLRLNVINTIDLHSYYDVLDRDKNVIGILHKDTSDPHNFKYHLKVDSEDLKIDQERDKTFDSSFYRFQVYNGISGYDFIKIDVNGEYIDIIGENGKHFSFYNYGKDFNVRNFNSNNMLCPESLYSQSCSVSLGGSITDKNDFKNSFYYRCTEKYTGDTEITSLVSKFDSKYKWAEYVDGELDYISYKEESVDRIILNHQVVTELIKKFREKVSTYPFEVDIVSKYLLRNMSKKNKSLFFADLNSNVFNRKLKF